MIFPSRTAFAEALSALPSPSSGARESALVHQDQLTKPKGSLGRLEEIAVFFAGWQGQTLPQLNTAQAVVFAGNHGVAERSVSAFPMEVTRQMVANFRSDGAAINALCHAADIDLNVVVLADFQPTADFTSDPALTEAECLAALSAGAAAVNPDADVFIAGEMGIGNTTPAAALCAHLLGGDVAAWTGSGTGIHAEAMTIKQAVIAQAVGFHRHAPTTAFETLRRLGGHEIAAMAGAILQARRLNIPVVLDGFICSAAILPLACENPSFTDHILAGHCSAEPGHARLLEHLGLEPLLQFGMRLGEGTGAAVAVQILRSALAAHNRMATFAQAGVSAD